MTDNRKYKEIHDLKVLLIYKKIKETGANRSKLAESLSKEKLFADISAKSIQMRLGNFISWTWLFSFFFIHLSKALGFLKS